MNVTQGALLGGRISYAQPAKGYRTGLEPVILAACVPAQPGDHVLEAGTGAGAGLLCLAARVPGLRGLGVERDTGQAALARANFAANGSDGLAVAEADLLDWRADGVFDHAFANPPWHDPAGTPSPDAQRSASKRGAVGLLNAWTGAMARVLRPRGTLSLVLSASLLSEAVLALAAASCSELTVFPLWPKCGTPAKLMILQAVHRGRGKCVLAPGLTLHGPDGALTAAAQALLRDGKALPLIAPAD